VSDRGKGAERDKLQLVGLLRSSPSARKNLREGTYPLEIHRQFIGTCNNGLNASASVRAARRATPSRGGGAEALRPPACMGGSWGPPNGEERGNKELRPNGERGGERMRPSSIDIFYHTTQQRHQARRVLSDAASVFRRSVSHESKFPGE
jgi:hypothetical protein